MKVENKFPATAKLVVKLRKQLKMTQRQLAQAVGYDGMEQCVSNIERGIMNIPKRKIDAFASGLGVNRRTIVSAIIRQQRERM